MKIRLPGEDLIDPRRRMAMRYLTEAGDTSPVQHWSQGATRLVKALMGNYLQGQADEDQAAAIEDQAAAWDKAIEGYNTKQWVNPDTGAPTIPRGGHRPIKEMPTYDLYSGRSPDDPLAHVAAPSTFSGNVPGEMVPTGPAGGFAGARAALSQPDMRGNLAAGRLSRRLFFKQMEQQEALAAENRGLENAQTLKRSPGAPVSGRDVPFPPGVQTQKINVAAAKPPTGYTFSPDGKGLVAIPGGPADRPAVSHGQQAADREFGKEYAKFVAGGGFADAEKNLGQLREVKSLLDKIVKGESSENLSGPVLGRVPDFVKAFTHPEAIGARDRVEEVIQRNLRLILGGQFSEKEGKMLIARAYNPSLEEAENAARLGRLVKAMERGFEAKKSAARYFEEKGTLAGYKGVTSVSMDELVNAIEPAAKPAAKPDTGEWGIREIKKSTKKTPD